MKYKLITGFILGCLSVLATISIQARNTQCLVPSACGKVELSPDGQYVAMMRKDADNLTSLLLVRLADMDSNYYYPRDYRSAKHSVLDFDWVSNDALILTSDANKDARSLHKLTLENRSLDTIEEKGYWDIVDSMPQEDHYLVSSREKMWSPGRIQIIERSASDDKYSNTVYECTSTEFQCVTDSDHQPRLIKRNPSVGKNPVWYWNKDGEWVESQLSGWTPVIACEYGKKQTAFVAGWFGSEPSISVYDFSTGQIVNKFLEHPDFSIDRYSRGIINAHPRALMGVRLETAIPKDIWLTKKIANLQTKVDETLSGTINQFLSWDKDFKTLIVKRTLLDSPSHYVCFDATTAESKLLVVDGGDIHDVKNGRSTVIQILTDDGTSLPAFLTIPQTENPKSLPLVVFVEPDVFSGLSQYEWNPACAYMATQGFVVLRMNSRVTPGLLKGNPEAMKSINGVQMLFADIDKAIRDLVDSGLVNGDRVCIAGSGAGAWVSAAAPFRCQTHFRAVTSINGVYDLELYRKGYKEKEALKDIVQLAFADPESGLSDADLNKLSPVENLDRYTEAIYLTIGQWSPNNFKNQITKFSSLARKKDIIVRLLEERWWATNMSMGVYMKAWEDATQLMLDYSQSR